MAKQMGIHQIRGKVGERSYYRTKGVVDGISRSINQGMSARVKTAEEYANTRLNNAEFKNANAVASAAFNSVNTRKKGMMRTFAVAEMTKRALEDIKQGAGSWGQRLPLSEMDVLICDMLENYAKGGAYDGKFGNIFISSELSNEGEAELTISVDETTIANLKALGIEGFLPVLSACLAGEKLIDGEARLFAGHKIGPLTPISLPSTGDVEQSVTVAVGSPGDVNMSQAGFTFAQEDPKHGFYLVLTLLPFANIGSGRYTLQEHCTYVAIPLGQIPE